VVHQSWLNTQQQAFPVHVTLAGHQERPISGFVTPYGLSHKVPRKAQKEFLLAEEAHKNKKIAKAIEHLRNAITADPGFVQALNNLGVRLAETGAMKDAEECFERAYRLDSNSAAARKN